MIRRWCAVILGLFGLLALPAGAAAQEPGVHLDPGSPAGKEYAIPLEDARRTGGSEDRRTKNSAADASTQLFGAGVRRVVRSLSPDGSPARTRRGAPAPAPAGTGERATPYLNATRSSGGPATPLIAGGSAVAVLLLGGALLALMRRGDRSRRD